MHPPLASARALARGIALLLLLPLAAAAQVPADDSVAASVRGDGTRHAGAHAVVWIARGALAPDEAIGVAAAIDGAVASAMRTLGRDLDRAHYDEDTVQVFVSPAVTISHVYGGYDHPRHRKPYLYLDPAKLRSGDAPIVHEASHLVAWRYGSHSLREGLASWVEATAIERGELRAKGLFGVGSPRAADERARALLGQPAAEAVLPSIGRVGAPDEGITSPEKPRLRQAYYVLSQSFAQHVVRALGVERALRLYEADDAGAYERITGRTLAAWKQEWLAAIGTERP